MLASGAAQRQLADLVEHERRGFEVGLEILGDRRAARLPPLVVTCDSPSAALNRGGGATPGDGDAQDLR